MKPGRGTPFRETRARDASGVAGLDALWGSLNETNPPALQHERVAAAAAAEQAAAEKQASIDAATAAGRQALELSEAAAQQAVEAAKVA
mgnify:CR=1 FL=1